MYSEKELIREFEKIASTLVPDKDWSIRIAAMQRFEGLVIGGLLISQHTIYVLVPILFRISCLLIMSSICIFERAT